MSRWRQPSIVLVVLFLCLSSTSKAFLSATEDAFHLVLTNDRLYASMNKSTGVIDSLALDGQNLLGSSEFVPVTPGGNAAGQNGILSLDCYCVPPSSSKYASSSGSYQAGSLNPTFQLFQGIDSGGVAYGGILMSEVYTPSGQIFEQYWFLRDGETGLHSFSRLAYHNETTPFLRNLQEFRTLFRPTGNLWTHISTNDQIYAPLPSADIIANSQTVQDATWFLGNYSIPYTQQFGEYFTKYTFSDTYGAHNVHGSFSDGTTSADNSTFGAWLVMNTKDTYFGGPTHSDLLVDGIVYNYISSNHHGDNVPNITTGFDRTFGPQFFYFNKGPKNASLADLRHDADQYASPTWNAAFYDSIAPHVTGYVPTANRTTWCGKIDLPRGAMNPVAVLSQSSVDYQDNVLDVNAYQYWGDVNTKTGEVEIPMVKAGTYRLTVYADNIWGQYVEDDIVIEAGKPITTWAIWCEESSGTQLWQIGIPDKSSGEYLHGNTPDGNLSHPLHPPQYRIYWGAYDFPSDFPNGVVFHVGQDKEADKLNYIHWSVFGGYADSNRAVPYYENVNNWTVLFNASEQQLWGKTQATLTVQLAGAKTAAGNTDVFNASEPYANLPYTVVVNGHALESWIIPWNQSSSCGTRSAVVCYTLSHKFQFDASLLEQGANELILSLPANATDYESAVLPRSVYVQYDAIRFEVS